MTFGNDSSIRIETSGDNSGIQIGKNMGSVVLNQGISEHAAEQICDMLQRVLEKNGILQLQRPKQEGMRTKWYRADTGAEIAYNELIKSDNITVQLDGNIVRSEILLNNGKLMYVEYDMEQEKVINFKLDGFPEDYELELPEVLILSLKQCPAKYNGINMTVKEYELKFGGYVQAIYDKNSKLQYVDIHSPAGMHFLIDVNNQLIRFIKRV